HGIEVTDGTPTHLKLLLESGLEDFRMPHLKHMLIGGEALTKPAVEAFYRRFNGCPPVITNVYGPTECTVDTTSFDISVKNIQHWEEIPIGKPMPNVQVYILSGKNQLQPIGCAGELCIGGNGVGRGYLNNPQLTSEKFIQPQIYTDSHRFIKAPFPPHSPTQPLNHSTIYKSGDLARWLPDGNIEFLGRKDHQVKIRGNRVEPEQIEKRLASHKDIKAAVVLDRESEKGEKYLCAYIVADMPGTLDITALRDYLSEILPGYMMPSYFVFLEALPLTSYGKVDRKALPAPEAGTTNEKYTAPRDELEKKLVDIWARVLEVEKERVGIDANFFQLGG
ncbi:MAG: non-ribosomal peptide synthetase, partial [bacterium]|nr:non-ribosomal peptide synthetase [bacterium]